MWKHVRNIVLIFIVLGLIGIWFLTRPDEAKLPLAALEGPKPELTQPRPEMFPTINVADVDRWKAGEAPVAAPGLVVERFAEGLDHPRNIYVLPNGDVLVAESNSPPRDGGGIEGMVMRWLLDKAGAGVPSANRISLLRDADGDGKAELKTPYITGLNAPFGMVLVGDTLYVANTDAVLAFPYKEGATSITAKGREITKLNTQSRRVARWEQTLHLGRIEQQYRRTGHGSRTWPRHGSRTRSGDGQKASLCNGPA
jgi:glucose/arabinose dehydrogenase